MNRMIFALAAESNDQLIWDRIRLQCDEMFSAGPIAIKFAYFGREVSPPSRPFVATRWCTDSDDMADSMDHARHDCVCGCFIQINDILEHALHEARQAPLATVVIVGDHFHGDVDDGLTSAKRLGAAGTRVFVFQQGQGGDEFKALAEATGGAFFQFNLHVEKIAKRLPRFFEAITQYTLGGKTALEARDSEAASLLLEQMNDNQITQR
jgi:hypothetical protein